jgi:hypothetical protein
VSLYIEITARGIVAIADPTPSPVPGFTGDPNLISPGIAGFLVTAFVAVATVLLILDMTRRIRRVRYRAEVRERLESEKLDAELRALAEGSDVAPGSDQPCPDAPKPSKTEPAKTKPAKPKPDNPEPDNPKPDNPEA